MLFHCMIFVHTNFPLPSKMFFSSFLLTKQINNDYYLCIKNSNYPNGKTYNLAMLRNVNYDFLQVKKLQLEFKSPKEILFIQCKDKKILYTFYKQLENIIVGKHINVGIDQMPEIVPDDDDDMNNFDPNSSEFIGTNYFNNFERRLVYLNKVVLEGCNLSIIPEGIGNLFIEYLSISGNNLPTSQYEQDIFWNWTTKVPICFTLKTLKMDNIGLRVLPFEIMYLENLHTLSVFLPLFMENLRNLKYLYVSNNALSYYPMPLTEPQLKHVDISNNCFHIINPLKADHLFLYIKHMNKSDDIERQVKVKQLSHIVFLSMMDNLPRLKRQDIPRSLWMYFNVVGRCKSCKQWIMPDYATIIHIASSNPVQNCIQDQSVEKIHLQTMYCMDKNNCNLFSLKNTQ